LAMPLKATLMPLFSMRAMVRLFEQIVCNRITK
jgi:hypothetical protein